MKKLNHKEVFQLYKLLIVDDEYNIRQGLINTIPWFDVGVEVVGEATNGLDALEKVKLLKPDIVITDINMSKMNGLEFSAELKKISPDTKVIIISGYDEFEYAKRAIELDVFSYILKPIEEDELLKAIRKFINVIEEDKRVVDKLQFLENEFKTNLSIMKDRFVNDIIEGVFSDENEVLHYMETAEIKLENPCYGSAVFNMDGYYEFLKENGYRKTQLIMLGIREIILEIFKNYYIVMVTIHNTGNVITIISGLSDNDKNAAQLLNERVEKAKKQIKVSLGVTASVGIGSFYERIVEIRKSYSEAQMALSYKAVLGTDCFIYIGDIIPISGNRYIYPSDKERQLIIGIDNADEKKVCEAVDSFLADLKMQKLSMNQLSASITGLLQILIRRFMDYNIDLHKLYADRLIDAYEAIKRFDTIEEINNWLTNIVLGAVQALNDSRKSNLSQVVKKAKEYIVSNFPNPDISVSQIADYLYLNPNYFSNLFKKESGESCMDFLTKTRIEEAKRLISNTNMKTSDIGCMVGYINPQYFCTLFKKVVGKTPAEFRNR